MRLACLSVALSLTLGALSAAHARPPGPSVPGPRAHHSSAGHHNGGHADHHGQAGHADQHHTNQPNQQQQHHSTNQPNQQQQQQHSHATYPTNGGQANRGHQANRGQTNGGQGNRGQANGGHCTCGFQGKVVMVQVNADGKCGRVWARDGRGQVQMFHVSNGTQVGGTNVQGLKGVTAGTTVHVQSNQQNAIQLRVNGMGTCSCGTSMSRRGAFTGRVVSAHRSRDGDRGSLAVQAANGGPTKRFQVTSATYVSHPTSGGSNGQTTQFVRPGQTVAVHSNGNLALQIDVLSQATSPAQAGGYTTSIVRHSMR